MTCVQLLASKFPGQTEEEYRRQLGRFGITGQTGLQVIGTLSGGQKSRVVFTMIAMSHPHVLVLDEVIIFFFFILIHYIIIKIYTYINFKNQIQLYTIMHYYFEKLL